MAPNDNVLEGYRCPECGHEESFNIDAKTTFDVTDDGTGDHNDVEFPDDAFCECRNEKCLFNGQVKSFQINTQKVEPGMPCEKLDEKIAPAVEGVARELYHYLIENNLTSDEPEEVDGGIKDVLNAMKFTKMNPLGMCIYLEKMESWSCDDSTYDAFKLIPHFRYLARRKERSILKV